MEFESPGEAAQRIAREQLEIPELPLRGPEMFSEAYPSMIDPESGTHWDLHSLFRGAGPAEGLLPPAAWRDLAYVGPTTLSRAAIARGHAYILALAGFGLKD